MNFPRKNLAIQTNTVGMFSLSARFNSSHIFVASFVTFGIELSYSIHITGITLFVYRENLRCFKLKWEFDIYFFVLGFNKIVKMVHFPSIIFFSNHRIK